MKKIILTLAIAVSSIASFASEKNVTSEVLSAFNKEFTQAKEVEWTKGNNYFKATFILNDKHIAAFYNNEGELMGLTRNISSLDLPINLQTNLKKNYDGYWITDLFEVSNNEGTNYYIRLQKADATVVLESTLGSKWTVYKKATKS